jgi:hypothetical protein
MTQQNPALQKIGDKMYVAGGAAPGSTVIAKMWVRSAP